MQDTQTPNHDHDIICEQDRKFGTDSPLQTNQ